MFKYRYCNFTNNECPDLILATVLSCCLLSCVLNEHHSPLHWDILLINKLLWSLNVNLLATNSVVEGSKQKRENWHKEWNQNSYMYYVINIKDYVGQGVGGEDILWYNRDYIKIYIHDWEKMEILSIKDTLSGRWMDFLLTWICRCIYLHSVGKICISVENYALSIAHFLLYLTVIL